jgi:SAM-dependent methyltransferase
MKPLVKPSESKIGRKVYACPACHSSVSEQIGGTVPARESAIGERVFMPPAYSIRSCAACGLYFKSNTLGQDDLAGYNSGFDADSYDHDENFPPDRILRGILRGLETGARVLDFGCSAGRVHKGLTARIETYGVEINEQAAAIARERGIRIISEEDLQKGLFGSFDVIIAADVYEHLTSPADLMAVLASAMKPGGRLIIVTGNGDAIRTREWMAEFWYFQPEVHLNMMSEKHARWLAKHLSMQVERLERCSHYDLSVLERLRQHLQSFAYGEFKRSPNSRLSTLLRLIPLIQRAENWRQAPALTCTPDHFVAVFRKN